MATKPSLTDIFCSFVKIASPTNHEQEFSNHLKQEIEKLGYSVFQDERGSLIVNVQGEGEPLLLAAHIDTVEPGRGINPRVVNGVLKSSGDTILGGDNKATVTTLFALLRWIQQTKMVTRPLDIVFSVSEESGVSGIDTLDLARIRAKFGLTLDADRPIGSIILSSPYYLRLDLEIIGTAAHASRAHQGQSALPALAQFLSAATTLSVPEHVKFNIGLLQGGRALNSVLHHVTLSAEIRGEDLQRVKEVAQQVQQLLHKSAEAHHCQGVYSEKLENEGYSFMETDPYVQLVAQTLTEAVQDLQITFFPHYHGITDANNLNKRGIKTVNIGNGNSAPHTVEEELPEIALTQAFEFLKLFVTKKISL